MNCSIDASKFEQVTQPLTAANVPPTISIGVAIGVRSGFNPTTSTSTACVAPVALMLTVEPPLREMLLKLYCAGGLLATRTMLMCDASETLGSDSVVPWPLMVMVLPLTEQLVPVSPGAGHVA